MSSGQFPDLPAFNEPPFPAYTAPSYGNSAVFGMQQPGNIDLKTRPIVHNRDGSYSSVLSGSYNFGGKEVLLPHVSDDGRILTKEQAIEQYRRTGRHLGVFDTPAAADAYASRLHNDYAEGKIPGYPAVQNPASISSDQMNQRLQTMMNALNGLNRKAGL